MSSAQQGSGVNQAVKLALEMVPDDGIIGLGTGRAATAFVRGLGERVQQRKLRVRCVPTSQKTADLASSLGMTILAPNDVDAIDITFDGADEVSPQLDLIKGLGGALVREKIVASLSRRLVIIAGTEKYVDKIGAHGVLPVEVTPFAVRLCQARLQEFGHASKLRTVDNAVFITDNHNHILDCAVASLDDPASLESKIVAIPGVVGTGLFLGMASTVLLYEESGVRTMRREA